MKVSHQIHPLLKLIKIIVLILMSRRNNEKSATEFYNLIYNYKNDCLVASIKFNKEFYKDSDLKPEKEIFFTLSLIPFGGVTTEN